MFGVFVTYLSHAKGKTHVIHSWDESAPLSRRAVTLQDWFSFDASSRMPTRAVPRHSMSRGSLCAVLREAFGSSVALAKSSPWRNEKPYQITGTLPYETPRGPRKRLGKVEGKVWKPPTSVGGRKSPVFPSFVFRKLVTIMAAAEERILSALVENGGEMFQSEIVRQSQLSKSRTSEILSSLERRSILSRNQQGRNYRIVLKTECRKQNYLGRKKHLRLGFTRAAEYPFVIPFRKKMRNDFGIEIDLRIYENGLDVARDLSILRLDLGIAPILSAFMFCSLGAPFKIIAPAGSGGSCVVSRDDRGKRSSVPYPRVATTKLSTMELLLKSSVKEHFLPDQSKVIYATGSEDMVSGLVSKRYDAACIWEPYATFLARKHGLSKLVSYNEIGEHICCALSAGNHLDNRLLRKVVSRFRDSITEFGKNPDSSLTQYSAFTGFDNKMMSEVSEEYNYPSDLNPKLISKQFERAGIQTPSPSSVKGMIRYAE